MNNFVKSDNVDEKSSHGTPIMKKIYLSNLTKLLLFFILFDGDQFLKSDNFFEKSSNGTLIMKKNI